MRGGCLAGMADLSIVPPDVEGYLRKLQPPGDEVLAQMGEIGEGRGFPIVGPLVGRFLEQQARAVGARTVFEMGSGFGYSTLWFARAVGPKGRVVHTDLDPGNSDEARQWAAKAGLAARIDFRVGDALALAGKDKGPYDVVFIDIDKEGYPAAWALARKMVRVGGLVLTDNTLWSGKVAKPARDAATKGVVEYNRLCQADADFLTTIVPLRDGVGVSLRLR